ncbi:MAG TPA: YbaB/EbfC family nucleoid-associated protein [Acidimicrobiales bacterium]|nr:YbaB/EbfC family nucleoid-associated protein [Acidimicrobiales bacterium]
MNEEEEFLPGGFGELLRQAQEMQEELARAQGVSADEVVEGHAGGGAVSVTVNGAMEFLSVHIDPEAVDPRDVGMLEDLVLAAVRDAVDKARNLTFGSAGGLLGGGLLGGSGLGGLLGGGGLEELLGGAGGDLMGPLQEMLQGLMGGGAIELEEGDDREVGGSGADPD